MASPRARSAEELREAPISERHAGRRNAWDGLLNLRGRGLVILTSCSHRGVVNAIRQAQTVSGVDKVHAVIGGFHLAPYQPDYLRETLAALKEIRPDYVIPLHCSGEAFYDMAKVEIPGKLVRAYTGTRLIFSA